MTRLLTEQELRRKSQWELERLKNLIKPQNHYFLTYKKSLQRSAWNTKNVNETFTGEY